jgi:hypothetical protein
MKYNVIIITEADFPDDPAFVYPFEANKLDDLEVGVREAIADWRRLNPRQNFLETSCTVLVEKAVFGRLVQAMADEVVKINTTGSRGLERWASHRNN